MNCPYDTMQVIVPKHHVQFQSYYIVSIRKLRM